LKGKIQKITGIKERLFLLVYFHAERNSSGYHCFSHVSGCIGFINVDDLGKTEDARKKKSGDKYVNSDLAIHECRRGLIKLSEFFIISVILNGQKKS
jgi:hypothetical protein